MQCDYPLFDTDDVLKPLTGTSVNIQTTVNSEKVDGLNENDMRENIIIIPDFEKIGPVGPAKHKINLVSPNMLVWFIVLLSICEDRSA